MKPKVGQQKKGGAETQPSVKALPSQIVIVNRHYKRYPDYTNVKIHALHCCLSTVFPPWVFVWMGYCVIEACAEAATTTYYPNSPPGVYVSQFPPPEYDSD
ncbi:uncharacterized protein [Littorina saxatilis]|uniref:Uncharacterized protein n=1 Tax=Littorina saxatilis TaxID=31220 RepID=A0AAN9AL34_9CAEN